MPEKPDGQGRPDAGSVVVNDGVGGGGFVAVPRALLGEVSPNALVLWIALVSHGWKNGRCYPGQETLMAETRLGEHPLRKAKAELVEAGLLVETRRGLGKTNVYTVNLVVSRNDDSSYQETNTSSSLAANPSSPHEVEEGEVEPLSSERGSARAAQMSLDGSVLSMRPSRKKKSSVGTDAERRLAGLVLAEFNRQAETAYTASAYVDKIVRRIEEHPELSLDAHRDLIRRNLATPWWNGTPDPRVIYGNGEQFERSMHSNGVAPEPVADWANFKARSYS